jgi:hypothetical protein
MDFTIDSELISLRTADFRKGQRPENRATILGKYLLQIASLSNIMDEYIDELALRKEIYLKSNIQLRRTLPQSNRWASDRFGDEIKLYTEEQGHVVTVANCSWLISLIIELARYLSGAWIVRQNIASIADAFVGVPRARIAKLRPEAKTGIYRCSGSTKQRPDQV